VRGVVSDIFDDEGATFLSGRTQPKKACFKLRGRESILAHEARSSVLADPEVSHLLLRSRQLNTSTSPAEDFVEPLSRSALSPMRPIDSQHYPLTPARDARGQNRREEFEAEHIEEWLAALKLLPIPLAAPGR